MEGRTADGGWPGGSPWRPGRVDLDAAAHQGKRGMMAVLDGYRRPFAAAVAAGVANQGLQITASALAAWVVAGAITGRPAGELWPWVGLLALAVVLRAAANWLEAWLSHELAFRILAEVRHWVYRAFDRMAPGGLVHHRSGDLVARAMADSEGMEMFYAHTLIYAVVAIVVPPLVLAGLALLAPVLALVVLPWLMAAGVAPLRLRGTAHRHGQELRQATGQVNTEVVDAVQGLREIVAFGRGKDRLAAVDAGSARLARAQLRQGVRAGGELASANLLLAGGVLSVVIVGAGLVAEGRLAPVWFPVAVVLAANVFAPVLTLLGATRLWGLTTAAADRVFELLHQPPAVVDRGGLPAAQVDDFEIRFEDASFSYDGEGVRALDGVRFTVRAGETVALVGHSGAGKSTCAHLLVRFWDPDHGRITIGGHDLRDLSLEGLRELVAYVPQDVYLFHESVAANLRLGQADAPDAELRRAVRDAQAERFVDRLPEGFATVVGERGARLSGGERQRVAIARALLRDAPILVLDESVSMLDTISERHLQAAMARAHRGRTALIIAHRLSTIRSADRVVVLERGRVVASGTHDELLAGSAPYRTLIDTQSLTSRVRPGLDEERR